jgi:predicted nucleic acid-binding protein
VNQVIVDAGPLIETLVPGAQYHEWVTRQWQRLEPPFLTCESVLSEAAFVLEREGSDPDLILEMVDRGFLKISLAVKDHTSELRRLMRKYRKQPMSLADACVVRLSELYAQAIVLTLDSDFTVYRRHGNKIIPLLRPDF